MGADQRNGGATGAATPADALVTVVVPCHHQAHLLGACLASVKAQTLAAWELVVVDDGSPDGARIAKVVEKAKDERIRLLRHETQRGSAAARNTGIEAAGTEYVLALDTPDRLVPGALEALVGALAADAALDCAYADLREFGRGNARLPFTGPPPGQPLVRLEHSLPSAGVLMRRSMWERLGGYDEAEALRPGRVGFDFWIRAFESGCRPVKLPEPVYERRVLHSTSDCLPEDDAIAEYLLAKHARLFTANGAARELRRSALTRAARAAYLRDERGRAFRLSMLGWRMAPTLSGLQQSVRSLLPYSANRAIHAGAVRRAIPFATYPLRGAARYRPFFVIGMGRSGNTLLRRVLTSHSQLHLPPETFVIGECIRTWRKQGRRMSWPDLVAMTMARFEFHPEFHLFEMDLAPLVQRLANAPRADRNLAHVLDAFFRHHAETHGRSPLRWGDKTPMNSLDDALARGDQPRRLGEGVPETLERLLTVFPDAQFLHIYRDGCDVTYSALRGGFFADLEAAARRWLHVESQTRRFAERHRAASHDVRYEDLVSRPAEVVAGICAFLGVEFEERMLRSESASSRLGDVPVWFWHANVAKPITPENTGKARRHFSRDELERLQRLIGPKLAEWGYSPATGSSST